MRNMRKKKRKKVWEVNLKEGNNICANIILILVFDYIILQENQKITISLILERYFYIA